MVRGRLGSAGSISKLPARPGQDLLEGGFAAQVDRFRIDQFAVLNPDFAR